MPIAGLGTLQKTAIAGKSLPLQRVKDIVQGIIEHVPSQVELKWGAWEALKNDKLQDEERPMYGPIVIEGRLLEEIAQKYEIWHGQEVGMVLEATEN